MRIKINISFILFLFMSIYLGFWQNAAVIFISVFIHEMGHVFVARLLRIRVLEIHLYPFGGIAYTENISKYGGRGELIVALAGPFVSLLITAIFYFFGRQLSFSNIIIKYNYVLFLFNLIPALPLDGGSVVRNMLLFRLSYKNATKYMTISGKVLSVLLLLYNIKLLLEERIIINYAIAAFFIFIGALREEKNCSYIYLLNRNNKKVRRYKNIYTRTIKASKETYLRNIVEQFSPANICIIMVYNEKGELIKKLCEADVMDGFLKYGYYGKIKNIIEELNNKRKKK